LWGSLKDKMYKTDIDSKKEGNSIHCEISAISGE
jgi:hypothetical protein